MKIIRIYKNICNESCILEIRELLAGKGLGARKITEVLRLIKRRAESHTISDEFLLELFTQQMPTSIQTILASMRKISPDKAAEIADRILDFTTANVSSVSVSVLTFSTDSQTLLATEMLLHEIQALRQEVLQLRQSRSMSRSDNKQRNRSQSRHDDPKLYWYHRKFHEKAKKSLPPCSYLENWKRDEYQRQNSPHHLLVAFLSETEIQVCVFLLILVRMRLSWPRIKMTKLSMFSKRFMVLMAPKFMYMVAKILLSP